MYDRIYNQSLEVSHLLPFNHLVRGHPLVLILQEYLPLQISHFRIESHVSLRHFSGYTTI
jgi:hypothetical protein